MSNPPGITSPPLRKLVRVPITIENLAEWIKQDAEIHYKCTTGIPPGAELDLVKLSEDKQSLVMFFKHESFEAVEASVFVPEFKCEFESLAPPVESKIPSAKEQEQQPAATPDSEPLPE
jgi:hypothetical protein